MKNINSRYSTMFNASIASSKACAQRACPALCMDFVIVHSTAQTNRIKIFIFSIDIVLSVLQNMNSCRCVYMLHLCTYPLLYASFQKCVYG